MFFKISSLNVTISLFVRLVRLLNVGSVYTAVFELLTNELDLFCNSVVVKIGFLDREIIKSFIIIKCHPSTH
jgi:hypothetical protein